MVGDGVEVVKDNLLKVHLDLLHLAKDYSTLAFDFLQELKNRSCFDLIINLEDVF